MKEIQLEEKREFERLFLQNAAAKLKRSIDSQIVNVYQIFMGLKRWDMDRKKGH